MTFTYFQMIHQKLGVSLENNMFKIPKLSKHVKISKNHPPKLKFTIFQWKALFDNPFESQWKLNKKNLEWIFEQKSTPNWPLDSKLHHWGNAKSLAS